MGNGFYHLLIRSQQMNAPILTQERLKEILHYDPLTGIFTWLRRIAKYRNQIGGEAGAKTPRGYINIQIKRKSYQAHRLAWLYVYGNWPTQQIDHIDRNPSNNRIANLRDVSATENRRNCKQPKNISSVYKGVSRSRGREKWSAQIVVNGRARYLGIFDSPENARAAYVSAAKTLNMEHLLADSPI